MRWRPRDLYRGRLNLRFPAGLANIRILPERKPRGTAGQRETAFDNVEVRCIYWNGGWIPGADVPFIGAGRLLPPLGRAESRVTSSLATRRDPSAGRPGSYRHGFGGTTGTPPSGPPCPAPSPPPSTTAATAAGDDRPWVTACPLYAHNSQLLVRVGQTSRPATSYLCPAAPAGPPARTSTSRCGSADREQTPDTTCQPHHTRSERI